MATRNLARINKNTTLFMMCDMQERFRTITQKYNEILQVSKKLAIASKILERPLIVTEHYKKVMGPTAAELLEVSKDHANFYEKTKFSMVIPEVEKHLGGIESVVLFGIETHVCITQTALDLLARGIDVHLVADASSSRCQIDRHLALRRLRNAGVVITTAESTLFDLVKDAKAPEFKPISPLVREISPDSGLLL